jgi:hypothetical protein
MQGLPKLITAAVLLVAWTAGADEAGDKAIKTLDEAMTVAEDQYNKYKCITQEPGGEQSRLTFEVHNKGAEWRRMEILGPADARGMRVLIRSLTQIYVYMPAHKKVRRVASHIRSRGFMGTTMSFDEMAVATYSPYFTGNLLEETDTHWIVEAILKPGADFPYPRLELEIIKEHGQASTIRYFNDKGVKLKTETRTDYKCRKKICSPKKVKMVDHVAGDRWTELTQLEWKVNTGIKDSHFTVRSLQTH